MLGKRFPELLACDWTDTSSHGGVIEAANAVADHQKHVRLDRWHVRLEGEESSMIRWVENNGPSPGVSDGSKPLHPQMKAENEASEWARI